MRKMIVKPSKQAAEILSHVLVADGRAVETDGSMWRGYPVDYAGPAQTVPGDVIARVLKVDKAPALHHGAFQAGTLSVPFDSLDPEDFPEPPYPDDPERTVDMAIPGLSAAIQAVRYAAARDDVRYYLNGVLVEISQGTPYVVATDGHRLHRRTLSPVATDASLDRKFIIPLAAVPHIAADNIRFFRYQGREWLQSGEIITEEIEGSYPEWRRIVPARKGINTATLSRVELLETLSKWVKTQPPRAMGPQKETGAVLLRILEDRVVVADHKGRDLFTVSAAAPVACDIGVNAKYFEEILKNLEGPCLELDYTQPNAVIQVGREALLMPVRV